MQYSTSESDVKLVQESALDLFIRLRAPWLFVKTGNDEIDELLLGGFVKGEISELVGSAGVGKTQLCLLTTANTLLRADDGVVIYIDTNASFRSERLLEILQTRCTKGVDAESLLSRVFVARVCGEYELKSALECIMSCQKSVGLLIIDSIGSALAQTSMSYLEGGKEIIDGTVRSLQSIAKSFQCAVLTTNHLVFWRKVPSPSLGNLWIAAVNSRFLMGKARDNYYMQMINSARNKAVPDGKVFYRMMSEGIVTTGKSFDIDLNLEVQKNRDLALRIFSQI